MFATWFKKVVKFSVEIHNYFAIHNAKFHFSAIDFLHVVLIVEKTSTLGRRTVM